MEFLAIDFETANEKRSSPCALGIAVVKNFEVAEKHTLKIDLDHHEAGSDALACFLLMHRGIPVFQGR